MVKAKDFWNYVCEELDYRFFAGVACPDLAPLYKNMNAKFMHYVPAVNERVGLGLVSGACLAGFRGGLLMDMSFAYDITSFLLFNIVNRIPLLVIGAGEEDSLLTYDFPSNFIKGPGYEEKIKEVADKLEKERVPGLIVIERGLLS